MARLVYLQQKRGIGRLIEVLLKARGTYIPRQVRIGRGLRLMHTAHGVVIHPRTIIGDRVVLFHNVTVGRARPWLREDTGVVEIGDEVIICAGAVIAVPSTGVLHVARESVVAANSVLTTSTGESEIWAGSPARLIGKRKHDSTYRLA